MLKTPAITCPCCFVRFSAHEAAYRCLNTACARRRSAPMGHIFTSTPTGLRRFLGIARTAKCDACSVETRTRLCPSCHFELTHDAGFVEDRVIAIIGGRSTGKSHYIATLIEKLEHEVGANFKWGLRMVGDHTRERFEADFRGPLFRKKKVLLMTQSAKSDAIVKMPMVFRLTFERYGRRVALNLSFFDTAGEDMGSLGSMAVETRYITRADGLIFLLDPLQLPAVRERLPNARMPLFDPNAEPPYLIDRLRDLFESQGVVSATKRVHIPVAFVLSKADELFSIIDPGSLLRTPGEHFGTVNLAELRSVHTEVWSYLERWIGAGFNNRVEQGFDSFNFFAVSALGHAPDEHGNVGTIRSARVEDPFLWILMKPGLVTGK